MCWGSTPYFTGVRTRTKLTLPKDYAGTPKDAIEVGLTYANVGPGDIVSDLGCGDGRWLFAAASRGATAYGYEIDAALYQTAIQGVKKREKQPQIKIRRGSLFEADLDDVDVIVLYQSKKVLNKLLYKLLFLPDGVQILSYNHELPNVQYDALIEGVYCYQTPLIK
jgi:tRNA A58 N-methylase Trm61